MELKLDPDPLINLDGIVLADSNEHPEKMDNNDLL